MAARILVVEDEPAIRELVAEILVEEGYEVVQAPDGAMALEAIDHNSAFDLVVLDMWMPNVNGWQFASALNVRGLPVPLLVMTAARDAKEHANEIGARGYIGKPFDVDQLLVAVEHALPTADR
jgi:DNA-binding response OmpR family regulator